MTPAKWYGATALLTGASRGIGPYVARALAAEGIHLALSATETSRDRLEQLCHTLQNGGVTPVALTADLSVPDQAVDLVRGAEAALGRIDILVNNAGIENPGNFADLEEKRIRQVIDTNLNAPLLLARLVLPAMIRRRRGAVIHIASMAGRIPMPTIATYSASKAGLIAWTESMASELEGRGVHVAAVCPTFVAEAGMHARTGVKAPWVAGEVSPQKVARCVVKALNGQSHDVLVTPLPTRHLLALLELVPGLGKRLKRTLGLTAFMARRSG